MKTMIMTLYHECSCRVGR